MANINENAQTSSSQNNRIAAYLKEGNRITQLEATDLFGCTRLASRINDLKNRGMVIKKETIVVPSGKRVAQYYL